MSEKRPLILIVDDVPKNLQVLGSILKEQPVDIAVATNGLQALKIVEGILPDLILLDVMMPELDGFETCKRLKADPRTLDIPVIFLTARTETEDVINGLKLGAVDYVTKPFNSAELLTRVHTHLDLKLSKDALREANATKDQFMSIIAHDLRTPFATLIGFSEYFLDDFNSIDGETKQEIVGDILSISKKSYQLLENLLQWARSQTGSLEFKPKTVHLFELVGESTAFLAIKAREKGIELRTEVPEDVFIQADENMLSTVIRNLVSNALKFTTKGGSIKILSRDLDGSIQISVEDTGIGMSEEIREKLFQSGASVSRKGTNDESGSGLGLLLVKEFIERHGGKIQVESEEGKGSRFVFSVPAG